MLMALETDAVDFICTDMPTAMGAVAAYPDMKILDFTDSDDNFEVDEGEINIGISVMKGNTELKNKINNAITDMIQDGSWQRAISDNTRGVAYTPNAKYNPPVPNGKGNK